MNNNFKRFCEQATDAQLENILKKEWARNATGKRDYLTAKKVAEGRGWVVRRGVREA